MVMSAGTSRLRKTGTAAGSYDANKELSENEQSNSAATMASIADNIDIITNDQGDLFYEPKFSTKLDHSFLARDIKENFPLESTTDKDDAK